MKHIVTPEFEYTVVIWQEHLSLLGHNRDYAYSLTMFENDDIDFYREENSPRDGNKYKTCRF
jgi:penicillin amidase